MNKISYIAGDHVLLELKSKNSHIEMWQCFDEVDEEKNKIKVTFHQFCNDHGTMFKVNEEVVSLFCTCCTIDVFTNSLNQWMFSSNDLFFVFFLFNLNI